MRLMRSVVAVIAAMLRRRWPAIAAAACIAEPAQPARFDVLIRNARVMDGTGNPWLRADVGITGDRITAVGTLDRRDRRARVIDARDRVVAPGFIDVHSHAADGHPERGAAPGAAAARAGRHHVHRESRRRRSGRSRGAARRARSRAHRARTSALLIGHGSVRSAVMGSANRAPTADELQKMKDLVRRGMDDGAFGLSSGLFYVPGSFAKTEEVIELAKVAAESGGLYTSHVRDEGNYDAGVRASVREVIRIAEEAKTIGIVTHMKALGRDSWGLAPVLLKDMEEARARGVQVFADQYPYEASSTSLRAALVPGGVEPTDGDRHGEPAAAERARRRADRVLSGRSVAGGEDADRDRRRRAASIRSTAALALMDARQRVDRLVQHVGARHRGDHAGAVHDGVERRRAGRRSGPGSPASARLRRLRAPARRLRARPPRRQPRVRDPLDDEPAGVGLRHQGPRRHPSRRLRRPRHLRSRHDRDAATYADPQKLAEGVSDVLVNGVPVRLDGKFTDALPGRVLKR